MRQFESPREPVSRRVGVEQLERASVDDVNPLVGEIEDTAVDFSFDVGVEVVGQADRAPLIGADDTRSRMDPEEPLGPVKKSEHAVDLLRADRFPLHGAEHVGSVIFHHDVERVARGSILEFLCGHAERDEDTGRIGQYEHPVLEHPVGDEIAGERTYELLDLIKRKLAAHNRELPRPIRASRTMP